MKPWGFALGALTGAAASLLLTRDAKRARPSAKAGLKAAIMAYHEVRLQGAALMEATEDLFAEAKAEAAADIFEAAMANGKKPAAETASKPEPADAPQPAAADAAPRQPGELA